MKFIFALIFSFYFFQLSAQSKLGVGIITSFDATGMVGDYFKAIEIENGFDKIGFGYQNGLRFRYQINSNLSLQTGLSLAKHQLRASRVYFNKRDRSDPLVPDSYFKMPTLRIIQIPVMVSFYKGNKLKFGGSLGFAYNYTYQYHDKAFFYFGNQERLFSVRRKLTEQNQFVSAQLGLGVEYLYKKCTFRAEPMVSYQLFYLRNEFANQNYNLYAVGFNLSGFYFF